MLTLWVCSYAGAQDLSCCTTTMSYAVRGYPFVALPDVLPKQACWTILLQSHRVHDSDRYWRGMLSCVFSTIPSCFLKNACVFAYDCMIV